MTYNPAQILSAVLSLRPGLEPGVDFELADLQDGAGPFISAWRRSDIAQPTKTEIEAVDTAALVRNEWQILPQDLMKSLTVDDVSKIQGAIGASPQLWLLWYSLIAQKDPMMFGNARFQAGWTALITVLGQGRMNEIATALGVPQ